MMNKNKTELKSAFKTALGEASSKTESCGGVGAYFNPLGAVQ